MPGTQLLLSSFADFQSSAAFSASLGFLEAPGIEVGEWYLSQSSSGSDGHLLLPLHCSCRLVKGIPSPPPPSKDDGEQGPPLTLVSDPQPTG